MHEVLSLIFTLAGLACILDSTLTVKVVIVQGGKKRIVHSATTSQQKLRQWHPFCWKTLVPDNKVNTPPPPKKTHFGLSSAPQRGWQFLMKLVPQRWALSHVKTACQQARKHNRKLEAPTGPPPDSPHVTMTNLQWLRPESYGDPWNDVSISGFTLSETMLGWVRRGSKNTNMDNRAHGFPQEHCTAAMICVVYLISPLFYLLWLMVIFLQTRMILFFD